MMKLFGYARVSTTDQDLTVQREALVKAGVPEALIFSERVSGTSTNGRNELKRVLSILGDGDSLVVTRLDRLGRSLLDLASIAAQIESIGASLKVIEQPVDTSTSSGKAFFGMLSVFSQFETDIRRERQMEGIAKAKADGVYKGRKKTTDDALIRSLAAEGRKPAQIRKELGVSKSTVFRALRGGGHAAPT